MSGIIVSVYHRVFGSAPKASIEIPKKKSDFKVFTTVLDSGLGLYKFSSLLRAFSEWGIYFQKGLGLGERGVTALSQTAERLGIAMGMSTVPKTFGTIQRWKDSMTKFCDKEKGGTFKRGEKVFYASTELTGDLIRCGTLVASLGYVVARAGVLSTFGRIATLGGIVTDTIDIQFAATKLVTQSLRWIRLPKNGTPEDIKMAKRLCREQIGLALINLIKKIAGLAASILGLVGMIYFGALPIILTMTTIALVFHFYGEFYRAGTYKELCKQGSKEVQNEYARIKALSKPA